MQVTVTFGEKVFVLTVDGDLEVENLKALCEAETDVPVQDILLVLNGKAVDDTKKVGESGIADGDLLLMQRRMKRQTPQGAAAAGAGGLQLPDFSKIMVPGGAGSGSGSSSSRGGSRSGSAGPSSSRQRPEDDPAIIREMLRSNPEQLALLRQNNTRLADAYDSPDPEEFARVLKEQYEARAERERQRIRMLTADPFDMEAQRLIAQEIENKNIDQNMELAMEFNPESFGTVIMLYIDCVVNGHHIKAFVDSGAQATIMSQVFLVFLLCQTRA